MQSQQQQPKPRKRLTPVCHVTQAAPNAVSPVLVTNRITDKCILCPWKEARGTATEHMFECTTSDSVQMAIELRSAHSIRTGICELCGKKGVAKVVQEKDNSSSNLRFVFFLGALLLQSERQIHVLCRASGTAVWGWRLTNKRGWSSLSVVPLRWFHQAVSKATCLCTRHIVCVTPVPAPFSCLHPTAVIAPQRYRIEGTSLCFVATWTGLARAKPAQESLFILTPRCESLRFSLAAMIAFCDKKAVCLFRYNVFGGGTSGDRLFAALRESILRAPFICVVASLLEGLVWRS